MQLLRVDEVSYFKAGGALVERIINTRLLLNNCVRKHNYHSFVPSHEKRIAIGSLRNLNLPLIFSIGTPIVNKSRLKEGA